MYIHIYTFTYTYIDIWQTHVIQVYVYYHKKDLVNHGGFVVNTIYILASDW